MGNEIVEKIAGIVKELPSLPSVAQEVLRQLQVPGTTPAQLQAIMSRDPSLSLRVLRLANSAYYRRGREISSLSDAIVLLGFKSLQSLVISSAVQRVLSSAGAIAPKLWEHCFAVGLACREVAAFNRMGQTEKEEAFLAGLFHDVAKGVMASRFPGLYAKPVGLGDERELLGFDHALLGQVLLTKWQIPGLLAAAVGTHHSTGAEGLGSLIMLGNVVAEPVAPGVAPTPRPVPSGLLESWKLDEESLEVVRSAVGTMMAEERGGSDG